MAVQDHASAIRTAAVRRRRRADRRHDPHPRGRHRVEGSSTSATAPRWCGRSAPGCAGRAAVGAIVGRDGACARRSSGSASSCRARPTSSPATSRSSSRPGSSDAEVGYMGDDLQDLPVLARAGLSAAPADAAPEVQARVHWISARGRRPRRGARAGRARAARAGPLGRHRPAVQRRPDGRLRACCSAP